MSQNNILGLGLFEVLVQGTQAESFQKMIQNVCYSATKLYISQSVTIVVKK